MIRALRDVGDCRNGLSARAKAGGSLCSGTVRGRCRAGFTLIELMVVIAVIVILVGVVIGVGRSQVEKSKARETATLLKTLDCAAGQFAADNPLKVKGYRDRYGKYPPDELDGFAKGTDVGIPGTTNTKVSQKLLNLDKNALPAVDNGDIKAFALAVRLYSDEGAAILDRIQPKYRAPAHKDATGNFDEYLNRDDTEDFTSGEDMPLDYFVDAWGTPIAYFATAYCCDPSEWDNDTSNVQTEGDRLKTCAALRSMSNDVPVFVSYGPDGPEQFNADFHENGYPPDLIYDFNEEPPKPKYKFDHPLNNDNVYSNETVQNKILRGEIPEGEPI